MSRETPMLRQYRRIKARHPDALVLYRLGDFYELFEEDARVAARELGLVLTTRRFSRQVRLPMCGVPYRTVVNYIARLIERGHKVALVEQLEDARKAKGLVKRDVVRVITPGTVVEEALLQEKAENYLAALAPGKAGHGLAFVELSTGEFAATEAADLSAVVEELERLQPSELVLPASLKEDTAFVAGLSGVRPARISSLPDAAFAPQATAERLRRHLGVASLEAFGCADLPLAAAAAGAILAYLQINQPTRPEGEPTDENLAHLCHLTTYSLAGHMHLDSTTRRNLELTRTLRDGRVEGSLLGVLDCTTTAMGARLLRRWISQPLRDPDAIQARLDAVEELVGTRDRPYPGAEGELASPPPAGVEASPPPAGVEASPPPAGVGAFPPPAGVGASPPQAGGTGGGAFLRPDLRRLLDGLHDVERLVGRIGFGSANGRDLVALKRALERLPKIKTRLADARSARLRALGRMDEHGDVLALITHAIVDRPPILVREGGLIRPGYYAELDELSATAEAGRDWLAKYETAERERTGIKNLRIKYNQVFGFFIEVTRSNLKLVPEDYERRATVTHAERFVTAALKAKEAEVLAAEDRAKELEYELFVEVRRQVAERAGGLRQVARALAELDVLSSLAEVAARYGYVRPVLDKGDRIEIREGRHPVVERLLPDGERFVPNDAWLDRAGERLLVITGPNMAGKSVYIRQVALIALMAQMGSFCPAAAAHVGLADRIFVRAGASDDITQGRSTFLVEMGETAYILRHATPRSLIVLDEVGRGTSTYDGVGLAWAVGEHLHDSVGARVLFATHYHELTGLADHLSGAKNYTLAVKEQGDAVIFLRRVVPGGADRSYGIHVARLAGLPESVVEQAERVMRQLERERGEARELVELPSGVPRLLEDSVLSPSKDEAPSLSKDGVPSLSKEAPAPYVVGPEEEELLLPADDAALREVICELFSVDVANLTPVQALVRLNEWQRRLRGRSR